MSRKLTVEYPGAIYHSMNRGDRREPIFRDDTDRERFLETLGEACERNAWRGHALCLMPTHFHLVLETTQPTFVDGMKWFLGTVSTAATSSFATGSAGVMNRWLFAAQERTSTARSRLFSGARTCRAATSSAAQSGAMN